MKVIIIGGGPGGYVAAIRCAQYGGEVTVIEKKYLGGTCVNEGCIPTKALLKGVQPLLEWKQFKAMGFSADNPTIDKNKLQKHVQKTVKMSRQGISYLMKKNNINVVNGEAIGYHNKSVIVKKDDVEEEIPYDKLILAMGSVSAGIPGIKVDGEKIVYSDVLLKLEKIPASLLIVGGGVIGLEMATIYSQLGTEVTIVEWLDQLLACEDAEAVKVIEKNLTKNKVTFRCGCKVEGIEIENNLVKTKWFCSDEGEGKRSESDFDMVLVAIGRKPNIIPELLDPLNIEYSKAGVNTNNYLETNNPDVYCIGDLNGTWLLAHTASREGLIVADRIFDKPTDPINYKLQPSAVFTYPEFAAVGERKGDKTYSFPYSANGKARASGVRDGFVKIFVENDLIVGCTVVGEHATDMISYATIAIQEKMTLSQFSAVTFPHPTFSEIFTGVFELAESLPIQI